MTIKNRRLWWWGGGAVAVLLVLTLTVAACQAGGGAESPQPPEQQEEPEEINGVSPREVPVIVEEAYYQQDGKTLDQFIVDEDKEVLKGFYDLDRGPHGKRKDYNLDPSYRLTEYNANEDLYYYLLEYPGQIKAVERSYFKVIRTKKGWK